MNKQDSPTILAAIDLGSNSFHMVISRLRDDHFQVVDKLREMVQLRAGLDAQGCLSEVAQDRAIACLERFGQRIKELPKESVRVVGTNTLRIAKNSDSFLHKANKALGHSIEIITGEEEARLIYLGVAQTLIFDDSRRLVIDIGGGSTELIIGENSVGLERKSLEMGCVSYSKRFFPNGELSALRMKLAIIAAGTHLRSIQKKYRDIGWSEAIGASGTIRCVAHIVRDKGWCGDGMITLEALNKLIEYMVDQKQMKAILLEGMTAERSSVLPGGIAILKAVFNQLKIDKIIVSNGALREGLLYDLLGRINHDDERERTVQTLVRRYHVDEVQSVRIILMLDNLFEQVAETWHLNEKHRHSLHWAAKLHEIGLSISHDHYQKHSYYLLAHSHLPGFSREEQGVLAIMVRGQRRVFPKKHIKTLPSSLRVLTQRLTILLRLAMVFNRGRSVVGSIPLTVNDTPKELQLFLPEGWLTAHPLTEADLQQEMNYLEDAGIPVALN